MQEEFSDDWALSDNMTLTASASAVVAQDMTVGSNLTQTFIKATWRCKPELAFEVGNLETTVNPEATCQRWYDEVRSHTPPHD